jgi:hypothetical protein
MRRHLKRCPSCRQEWIALRSVRQELEGAASAPVPEIVRERIAAALPHVTELPPARVAERRARRWSPAASWSAVTVVALLLGALGLVAHRNRQQQIHLATERIARSATPAESPQAPRESRRPDRVRPVQPPVTTPTVPDIAPIRPGDGLRREQRPTLPAPGIRLAPAVASEPADDLLFLAGHTPDVSAYESPRLDEEEAAERRRLGLPAPKEEFVHVPLPRLVDSDGKQIAAAAAQYQREAAIVDARLARKVTLAFKATALSDLCDRVREETGIHLVAGRSVADEKVTLFCKELPLRDVMRQLSRPFGYTWLRNREPGAKSQEPGAAYRYELTQDLRSQLMEEELRNRDRNAALLALDREMQRYRNYLDLSPDAALARAKTAPEHEKKLLEKLAGPGWGVIQMYFRLSPEDLSALRAGRTLHFGDEIPKGDAQPSIPLPAGMRESILAGLRGQFVVEQEGRYRPARDSSEPGRIPVRAVTGATARIRLSLSQHELGQFTLDGYSIFQVPQGFVGLIPSGPVGIGMSPADSPRGRSAAGTGAAPAPVLRTRVSVQPKATCRSMPVSTGAEAAPEPKLTSADFLEALHQATGLPLVADFYTRLYRPDAVAVRDRPLAEALDHVAKTMRMRWNLSEGPWLQFRSINFYDDRLKEVPNRLLSRWAEARRQRGVLSLEELIEIAQLSDVQLDSADVAEGAKACFGLEEWDLVRHRNIRQDWRFLAQLTPAQRAEAQGEFGLVFTRLSLAQQQQFIAIVDPRGAVLKSLGDLAQASLHLGYTHPGGYEWRPTGPNVPSWRRHAPSRALGATREAALLGARRLDPQMDPAEIAPTELAVSLLFACGPQPDALVRAWRSRPSLAPSHQGYRGPERPGGGGTAIKGLRAPS